MVGDSGWMDIDSAQGQGGLCNIHIYNDNNDNSNNDNSMI